MNVPQILYLSNQTFNSDFIEFVWQFPHNEEHQYQVIFKVFKNGNFYLEGGRIGDSGEYNQSNNPDYYTDGFINELRNIPETRPINFIKRFFTFEPDLVSLANDSISFLT